jgi:hypothetical protein
MTSSAIVCGTGQGNFPLPGDPDLLKIVLPALPGFMGIAVSWTYPAANAHAVVHTLLFRSTQNNTALAAQIAVLGGDYYFDQTGLVEGQLYYYWIKAVSLNGPVGDFIGPTFRRIL